MLTIAQFNCDNYLDTRTYSAQQKPEYGNVWTDAWFKNHKDIVRKRISAQATLTFPNITSYQSFVSAINDAIDDNGYVGVELYVDTLGHQITIWAYVTYDAKTVFTTPAYGRVPAVTQVTVKIEER